MSFDIDFADDIIKVIEYLCKKFGIAIDWSSKTIMPYLQQLSQKYIAYRISVATMWIIVLGSVILIALITSLWITASAKKENYNLDSDDGWWWIRTIALVVAAAALGFIVYNVYIVIECRTFPEKVLFEYVKSIYDSGIIPK